MRENILRFLVKFGGISFLLFFILATTAFGATETGAKELEPVVEGGHGGAAVTILAVAVILFSAKIAGLIERVKQPVVIGELLAGIFLSFLGYLGLTFITDIRHNEAVAFLAEFGVILLLFQIGLETNIKSLVKVGPRSLIVALIGASVPFIVGTWVLGPIFFKEAPLIAHLFVGASLVATSVGIPASVYRDLGKTKLHAFKTFLGATVIDDVLGLIVLAVVSALASGGEISAGLVFTLAGKAFGFLIGSILLGMLLARHISKLFSSISTGIGMKLTLAIIFALIFAYGATLVGLAPIVGAFAAGLLLDPVHFNSFQAPAAVTDMEKAMADSKISHKDFEAILQKHKHTHVEDLISVLSLVFVPIFFAFTGLQIEIESLLNPQLYISAIIITILAVAAKVVAGVATKGSIYEKLLVGFSMVPRGEVGLIFAATGLALGAINPEMFSLIVIVIVLTTFIGPPFIAPLIAKIESAEKK